jgi:hypothetical protein
LRDRETAKPFVGGPWLRGGGPLVCYLCDRPIKGDTKGRRTGTKIALHRHHDGARCEGWPVRETPISTIEDQVARLLDGAAPNRECAARIRAAVAQPLAAQDRLAVARLDARLRTLATELSRPDLPRSSAEIVAEMDATRTERRRLADLPIEQAKVDPEDALDWLGSLGKLWRETSDEGRRHLAVATFERLGTIARPQRRSHRIVSVAVTQEAERRGLVLALPASLEVTLVGDTGFEPVTSRM